MKYYSKIRTKKVRHNIEDKINILLTTKDFTSFVGNAIPNYIKEAYKYLHDNQDFERAAKILQVETRYKAQSKC